MSLGRSVQYTKKSQVLDAYEDSEIPSWSIRNGNQLLWKYSGDDLSAGSAKLSRVLDDIAEAKSAGIYTLCLYEKEPEEIRLKTEYDMSFNFRFQEHSDNYISGLGGPPQLLLEEIRQMRTEIAELRAEIDERDEPPVPSSQLGTIGELLNNPQFMALIAGFFNKPGSPAPAQLSGVTESANARAVALEILDSVDPDLTNHLVKLATLAQNNPKKFKALISTLDLM